MPNFVQSFNFPPDELVSLSSEQFGCANSFPIFRSVHLSLVTIGCAVCSVMTMTRIRNIGHPRGIHKHWPSLLRVLVSIYFIRQQMLYPDIAVFRFDHSNDLLHVPWALMVELPLCIRGGATCSAFPLFSICIGTGTIMGRLRGRQCLGEGTEFGWESPRGRCYNNAC